MKNLTSPRAPEWGNSITFAQLNKLCEFSIINQLITFIAMRKFFTLLTLCMLASAAWAVDITFVAGVDNGNSPGTAQAFEIVKDGIKIEVSNGLANDTQYRIYKSQTATITSSIGAINQVVFECTAEGEAQYGPGCFTASTGSYAYSGKIGTWTGADAQIVFTAATNQVRCTKIVVTVGNASLGAPSITPASGTYYGPIEVNMTCATSGAKIYYTTNGSTPTTSSTQFTAPFTLSSNATVKAISAKDGEVSDVVSATYEFATATPVNNIAGFQNASNDAVVVFNNPVNVLAQHNNYLYVKDNSGYALFYGKTNQTYVNGDVIPAGFAGKKTTYAGEPELQVISGFQPASGNNPINPETITANQVGHAMFAHYVAMNGVTINKVDDRNYVLTDANGNTCAVYFGSMGVNAPSDLNGTFDVIGMVGSYGNENTVYQLLPTYLKKDGGGEFGWGTMFDTPDDTEVTFAYETTIIGQHGRYLYAMDETGFGLAYGDLGQTYKHGDVIPAGYSGKKTTYKGEPELAAPLAGFQAAIKNVKPTPEQINASQVDHAHWAHFVVLKNVMINATGTQITDANGNTCEMYNNTFQATLPADLTIAHDVYGVVGVYNAYQVLPLWFDEGDDPDPTPIDVANIPELYDLNQGQQGHFTTPLTTIYQYGPNLYVQDVDGNFSLSYGSVAYTEFVNGDFINDAVATWSEYQGAKQIVPVSDTFVKAGHGNKVEPEMMPIEEVSQDMIHWYLRFEGVTLAAAEAANTYMMADETGNMIVFHKFTNDENIVIPELKPGETYDVDGFLTIYKGQLELYPIRIVKHGEGAVDEVWSNKTVANVRYFNLAGQEMTQANGATIVVTTYTDGTTNAVKVMK